MHESILFESAINLQIQICECSMENDATICFPLHIFVIKLSYLHGELMFYNSFGLHSELLQY